MSIDRLEKSSNSRIKQYILTITANDVTCTDNRFTMSNLHLGDNYKYIDSRFKGADGEINTRRTIKYERKKSNQTLPKLACQIFGQKLAALSVAEKESFPTCQYGLNEGIIQGIYPNVEEFRKHRNTLEFLTYHYDNGENFVFYCWNIFSTITFVKECLKRFGNAGDSFELTYQDKERKEKIDEINAQTHISSEYQNSYTPLLLSAKNVVFRGAPGTGKTYLAQQIAADLVSAGRTDDIEELTPNETKQIGFVQFHPSYDYTDFVEGLRPSNSEQNLGFKLEPGTFKLFCRRAEEKISEKDDKSIEDIWNEFIESIEDQIVSINNYKFEANSRGNITYYVPGGSTESLTLDNVRGYLENGKWGEMNYHATYKSPIFEKYIKPHIKDVSLVKNTKPYIFIIDEINRGEISKIFGELFFSIDPGYRGKKGGVLTQYSNLHENPDEKFYIPENVYIIGTMNDIDRSVDTFDFAMRRRFTFLEVTAEESAQNMDLPLKICEQMKRINDSIIDKGGLTTDYQIGASYFINMVEPETDADNAPLWNNKIYPLLKDYLRGEHKAADKLSKIKKDYFNEEG